MVLKRRRGGGMLSTLTVMLTGPDRLRINGNRGQRDRAALLGSGAAECEIIACAEL